MNKERLARRCRRASRRPKESGTGMVRRETQRHRARKAIVVRTCARLEPDPPRFSKAFAASEGFCVF